MEEKIVHRSLFTTLWKRLVQRPRWKILTSSYRRCDVSDGLDLTDGSCKPVMNVHSPCNVGRFCTCWTTACFTRRQCCGLDDQGNIHKFLAKKVFCHLQSIQKKSEATPALSAFHAQGKMNGP